MQEKTCKPSGLQLYEKDTPTQVFSCEISQIFMKRFFHRTHPVAASVVLK